MNYLTGIALFSILKYTKNKVFNMYFKFGTLHKARQTYTTNNTRHICLVFMFSC